MTLSGFFKLIEILIRYNFRSSIINSKMSALSQICLYLSLIAIFSLSNCTPWQDWNYEIIANSGQAINNFTIPSAPLYWIRNYGIGAVNTNYTARKNQYLNTYSIKGLGTCNLYCEPRSFLVRTTVNNIDYIVCQRDNTANYWGGILDIYGDKYDQFCIPNVDPSPTCGMVKQVLSTMGNCDPDNIPSAYPPTFKSCCFLNVLKNRNKNYDLLDEVDFTASTSFTQLLDSEFI